MNNIEKRKEMRTKFVESDANGWISQNGLATEKEHRYMEDPANLLKDGCTDAQMWAKSWQATCRRNDIDCGSIDESWMISWLANAIETAKDSVHREYKDKLTMDRAYCTDEGW